jgi:hypothetical protein
MTSRIAVLRNTTVLSVGALLATAALGGEIEVIFTEVPGHPTATVPGAMDLNGDPVFTEFKALEVLSVSADGSQWILKGRNWLGDELETMLLIGSGTTGAVFAQEGQPVHDGEAGELYEFFGSSPPHFNELGQFVYTARARGGDFDTKQKGIFFDGSDFHMVRQESDPAYGLLDYPPNPSGDELFGNSFGSFHLLNNGVIGCQDSTIKNLHSYRRPAIFYDDTAFKQSGVTPINGSVWDSFDLNDFWTTPDGTTWVAQGDDEGSTATDDILVVNDVVVLREGSTIPGSAIVVTAVFHTKLLANGDWYSRGDDPSDNDWAVRNGTLLAATGDPIIVDSAEHWTAVFYSFTGNTNGDWVLAGTTDNGNIQTDSVIVLNGTDVVVREGDPVDLDGNGVFDDDAYIGRGDASLSAFHADDIFLTDDMMLYFFASLRNAAGEDLGSFGSGGDAFLRIDLSEGCPQPGTSGAYCSADTYPEGDSYCVIDLQDLGVLLASYGLCPGDPGYDPVANLNDDDGTGCVNLADLGVLLAQYGDDCN